jgi:hypothetical protein
MSGYARHKQGEYSIPAFEFLLYVCLLFLEEEDLEKIEKFNALSANENYAKQRQILWNSC